MLSKCFIGPQLLFLFLFTHTFLLLLKLIKLVCDSLLTHLDANDLHNLSQMINIIHRSFLVDLSSAQLLSDVLLSCKDQLDIILRHKCETLSAATRSSSSANTMHIVLGTLWHIKV